MLRSLLLSILALTSSVASDLSKSVTDTSGVPHIYELSEIKRNLERMYQPGK